MTHFQPDTGVVFDQADILVMKRALDGACLALSFAYVRHSGVDLETKELLARYIIGDASAGERDPSRLSEWALRRLPPKFADWARDGGQALPAGPPLRHTSR